MTTDIPATPFSVTVTAGATTALGNVTWTPARVGPTVFEIGIPDRNSTEFRHGDDYWVSDQGPSATSPSPIWGKYLDYPVDFPNGPSYTVGTSRWTTDWNYVQPVILDSAGNYDASTSAINFTPCLHAKHRRTSGFALSGAGLGLPGASHRDGQRHQPRQRDDHRHSQRDQRHRLFSRRGRVRAAAATQPSAKARTACYSDERITFAGSLLKKGSNVITIQMRDGGYFANHAMYDYLRLELTGYTPPAPGSVSPPTRGTLARC